MRFAPNSLDVVYVAGLGAHPPAPVVTVNRDGKDYQAAPGHDPGWMSDSDIAWCPPEDGMVQSTMGESTPVLPAGNSLTAAAGKVAVHRTDPRRVLTSWGTSALAGATDPVLSADGQWLGYLMPDWPLAGQSSLAVASVDRPQVAVHMWTGAPTRPRFSHQGTSVVWEGGNGSIYGIADVANPNSPVQKLSRVDDRLYHPVPLWVPERQELWVLAVQDRGDVGQLVIMEWGSCAAGIPAGVMLAVSSGSAYDHDVCTQGGGIAEFVYLSPGGLLRRSAANLAKPWAVIPMPPVAPPIDPPPPVLPDQPFVVDPTGVVEDIAAWLFSPNQGPDVHLSPDGLVRFYCKSDESSGDGPGAHIGEHWDRDAQYIGHLDDASTGRRILDGKEVVAEDIVRMFPETHAEVWAGLPLNHNWFKAGARLWTTRRCVSGTRIRYVTDIIWTVPPHETPHTNVWKNIPIEIRVDVGHGVIHGKEVRVRSSYVPDGHAEVSYYGEPKGYNAWVAGPFSTEEPEWMS